MSSGYYRLPCPQIIARDPEQHGQQKFPDEVSPATVTVYAAGELPAERRASGRLFSRTGRFYAEKPEKCLPALTVAESVNQKLQQVK
ncbi:Uncharacterised protein [Tatumella ptyseos]|uniref:Uncharacterized protein n=1 Tax=Tatumella ptyseos TaxID=82987 RepID=A0A2X5NLD0_9GAMM|nr:Uncharacterised protein [Tatumella ptyseos]